MKLQKVESAQRQPLMRTDNKFSIRPMTVRTALKEQTNKVEIIRTQRKK